MATCFNLLCGINNGLQNPCHNAKGGIDTVYFANWDDIDQTKGDQGFADTNGDGFFDTIYMKPYANFFCFQIVPFVSTFNEEGSYPNRFFLQNLVLHFYKRDQNSNLLTSFNDVKQQIDNFLTGRLIAIVLDKNGVQYIVGKETPLYNTALQNNSGAALADETNYVVTWQSGSTVSAPIFAGDISTYLP